MSWQDVVSTIGQIAAGAPGSDPDRRQPMDEQGPLRPGEYYPDGPTYNDEAHGDSSYDEKYKAIGPTPRPVGNPVVYTGTTNSNAITKSDKVINSSPYAKSLSTAVQKVNDLNAIDPDNKDQLNAHYHGYNPDGSVKKDSVMGNIGKGLLASMKNIAPIMMDKNVTNKQALGYAIGAGLGGSLNYGITGTADEKAKLASDKQEAAGQMAQAQDIYSTDVKNRVGEANIEYTSGRHEAEMAKVNAALEAEKGKNFKRATDRFTALTKAMTTGPLSLQQSPQFLETLADLAGVPSVSVSGFDPRTDTIIKEETKVDADTGEVHTLTFNKGGKVMTGIAVDEATGKPISIKDPRVKAEEVRQAGNVTTTGMRTASQEKIASMRNSFELARQKMINEHQVSAKTAGMIFDESTRLASELVGVKNPATGADWTTTEIMDRATQTVTSIPGTSVPK